MKNQVNTASPEQLVLLLYNGALRFIRQARMGMEKKQIEQSHQGNYQSARHFAGIDGQPGFQSG